MFLYPQFDMCTGFCKMTEQSVFFQSFHASFSTFQNIKASSCLWKVYPLIQHTDNYNQYNWKEKRERQIFLNQLELFWHDVSVNLIQPTMTVCCK